MLVIRYLALAGCILGSVMLLNSLTAPAPQPTVKVVPKKKKLGSIVRLVRKDHTVCSGTVISPTIIVTAAHCVVMETFVGYMVNPEPFDIRADDNIDRNVRGSAVYATGQLDQAVIYGDFSMFEARACVTDPAVLVAARGPNAGFMSCGYPAGGNLYCASTYFVRPEGFFWAINGQLIPGMSGGPTMTLDGTVVAVNCAVTGAVSLVSPLWNLNQHFNDKPGDKK